MKILSCIVSACLLVAGDSARASLDAADTANSVESDGGSGTRLEERFLLFLLDGGNRIVGGNPADKTRYPYFTALFHSTDIIDNTTFLCGGSLIREDVVMTAGHCIIQDSPSFVQQVFVNFTSFDDLRYGHARNVSSVFRHPDYYSDADYFNSVNDIALLFLESPVSGVTTLALNGDASIPIDNEIITAIGIGSTQEGGSQPSVLMEVDVPKVNNSQCVAQYQGVSLIDPTVMVCAGYENGGNDTCSGDSGGPYIIVGATPMDDVVVGITSFGEGCARPGFPGVNTRVSAFKDWVMCVLEGDCTQSPTGAPTPYPTPPPPIYLPGPVATINVTLNTDAHTGYTDIEYRNICTFDARTVVDGVASLLPFTTYYYTFTLPVGMYEFTIKDYHAELGFDFLGSILFSSGNVTLHEISTNQVFSEEIFHIVIGDGGICTPSPTQSPTAPPQPIYLPGPVATINVAWTTDAHTNLTQIYYFDGCTFEQVDVVDGSNETLEAFTTYYYTFTLPVGQYEITTIDYYYFFDGLDFLDRIVFSSSNDTLHEISGNIEFFKDNFQIVVGDGEMCSIPNALPTYPTISPAPSVMLSTQTPSDLTDATCDDIQDVKFPVLLDGILTQKTCDWLAGNHREAYREALCVIGNVAYDICAETCKKCSDTCVDEEGDFPSLYFHSKMVSCEDLAKHGERWRGKYCDEGLSPMAEMLCKETCNTCD